MSQDAATEVESVSPGALQRRIDAGEPVRVLDLRDRDEVDAWRITGSSVTLTQKPFNRFVQARVTDSLDEFVADVEGSGPITVVCARGEASRKVAEELAAAGHEARNLEDGMHGWARLYRAVELDPARRDGGDATLVQYRRPSSGCLAYLIVAGDEAVVVDPLRAFTDRYVADADDRGAEIRYVVDTHVHADHVSGLRDLAAAADARPVVSESAADRGVSFDATTVSDGDELDVGDATIEAVAAPGHTSGMTAFAVDGALLTGDSLFLGSIARPDLEQGEPGARDQAAALYRTVTERFDRFPDETLVAPGHYADGTRRAEDDSYTAPLGDCRGLPVFRMTEREFVDYVTTDLPARPPNHEAIVAINLGEREADADEAFELELGPNNCAATPIEAE